jgi:hypothetical protein
LLPSGVSTYRAFRVDWAGAPGTAPAAALVERGGKRTVYASWNGDTRTAKWRLTGAEPGRSPKVVTTVAAGAYETALPVPKGLRQLRVQALDAAGSVLATVKVI